MATLADAGVAGYAGVYLHPKHQNKWIITFQGIGRAAGFVDGRDITVQTTTVQRPNLEFGEVALHRYNSTAYVAGKHEWQPMSLTFEDDINGLASNVLKAQLETTQRLVGNSLGIDGRYFNTAATGSDYKFAMTLKQLDGDEGVVEMWVVEGAWIKSADFGELDYSSAEAVKVQLSIRFDHAYTVDLYNDYGAAIGGFGSAGR